MRMSVEGFGQGLEVLPSRGDGLGGLKEADKVRIPLKGDEKDGRDGMFRIVGDVLGGGTGKGDAEGRERLD